MRDQAPGVIGKGWAAFDIKKTIEADALGETVDDVLTYGVDFVEIRSLELSVAQLVRGLLVNVQYRIRLVSEVDQELVIWLLITPVARGRAPKAVEQPCAASTEQRMDKNRRVL